MSSARTIQGSGYAAPEALRLYRDPTGWRRSVSAYQWQLRALPSSLLNHVMVVHHQHVLCNLNQDNVLPLGAGMQYRARGYRHPVGSRDAIVPKQTCAHPTRARQYGVLSHVNTN